MNKIKVLVSIIIPTYNCEKYIGKAVKFSINQTYRNIEKFRKASTDKRNICPI